MATQSDPFPLDYLPALPVALTLNSQSRDPDVATQDPSQAACCTAPVSVSGPDCFSFLQLEYECHTSSSTVMIFNPDFSFAGTIRTTHTRTHTRTVSRSAHIRGKSTSWLDGETPITPSSTTRLTITTPTCKYDVDLDLEVPLSPKSLPTHMHPFFAMGAATAASATSGGDHKDPAAAGGVVVRHDVAAKLSLDRGKPNRRRPLPLQFTAAGAGLERRRTPRSGGSFNQAMSPRNADECCDKVHDDRGCVDELSSTEKCRVGEAKSIPSMKSTLNATPSLSIPKEQSQVQIKDTTPSPKKPTKKLRPKLHLRTASIIARQRAPTPQPVQITTAAVDRNRPHNLPKDRCTSSPDVSRALSQQQRRGETETATATATTQHRRRTSVSRLPLHALLLSPLGARRRFSSDSTATMASSSSAITTDTNTTTSSGNITNITTNTNSNTNTSGTATPASVANSTVSCGGHSAGGSVGRVRGSVFSFRLHEVDEEEEEDTTGVTTAKGCTDTDMVSSGIQQLSLGSSKDKDTKSSSRFRRFSLAYLGGGEHEADSASESRSPLRGWRSWSNRSSIASFVTSNTNDHTNNGSCNGNTTNNTAAAAERVNNSRSYTRRGSRFSIASLGTSYGSTSTSSSTGEQGSACTATTSVGTSGRNSARYSDASVGTADERHRSSLSWSSITELPWRTVPVHTYAHLMSSRRNSAANTPAQQTASIGSGASRTVDESGEREDPFTAFCNSTKPKGAGVSSRGYQSPEERAARMRRRAEKVVAQIQAGGFYDSGDEDEDEDERIALQMIAEEGDGDDDVFGYTDVHDWWMAGVDNVENDDDGEDGWRGVARVPSLEFEEGNSSRVSVEGPLPVTPTAVDAPIGFAVESVKKMGRRRRTASSECLMVEAAEGLRGLWVGENEGEECAVEE
ncbi:hypothetical protein TWF696_007802 [Orbilia brochopaga]|uniref:Uncharacterized protein n=1 Tax=Orbilia brochopaga TaxID=3140254 RepID=A0AAV9UNL3_9PEZI